MPSLTPFAEISFDDKIAIQSFLQAHAARHSIYQQASVVKGFAFASTNLTTYPDQDWFARHLNVHAYLNQLQGPNSSAAVTTLADYDWSDENSFYNWMQTHQALHLGIDQFFGLTG